MTHAPRVACWCSGAGLLVAGRDSRDAWRGGAVLRSGEERREAEEETVQHGIDLVEDALRDAAVCARRGVGLCRKHERPPTADLVFLHNPCLLQLSGCPQHVILIALGNGAKNRLLAFSDISLTPRSANHFPANKQRGGRARRPGGGWRCSADREMCKGAASKSGGTGGWPRWRMAHQ